MKNYIMPLPLLAFVSLFSLTILSIEAAVSDFGEAKIANNVLCMATKLKKAKNRDDVVLGATCALERGKHKRVSTDSTQVILNYVNRQERMMRCDIFETGYGRCRPARVANKGRN